jgi:hypothetical protein
VGRIGRERQLEGCRGRESGGGRKGRRGGGGGLESVRGMLEVYTAKLKYRFAVI